MRTRMQERDGWRIRWAVVAAVATVFGLAPTASRAQGSTGDPPPFATLKLYEVQEGTDLKPAGPEPALRLANAALVGSASGGLCTGGQDPCAFDTVAKSSVPFKVGVGPIHGNFQVLFDTMSSRTHLLSDLVLIAKGSITGTLDLRSILNRTAPIAPMKGQWKSKALDARGTFSGTFFVPVTTVPTNPGEPDPCPGTHFAYFDPSTGLQCLITTEFSLGRPVTKVEASFIKTGRFRPGDDDDDRGDDGHGGKN
jgi:hypothetical protein